MIKRKNLISHQNMITMSRKKARTTKALENTVKSIAGELMMMENSEIVITILMIGGMVMMIQGGLIVPKETMTRIESLEIILKMLRRDVGVVEVTVQIENNINRQVATQEITGEVYPNHLREKVRAESR